MLDEISFRDDDKETFFDFDLDKREDIPPPHDLFFSSLKSADGDGDRYYGYGISTGSNVRSSRSARMAS